MPDGPDFCNFEPVKEVLCQLVGVREELRESLISFSQKQMTLKRFKQLDLVKTVSDAVSVVL